MATQSASDSEQTNYAAQAAVAAAAALAIKKAFSLIDPTNLRLTLPKFITAAQAVTSQYGAASRSLAVAHYADLRQHAGVSGNFQPKPVNLPPSAQVESAAGWATTDLWSPTNGTLPDEKVRQTAEDKASQAFERLVLNVGREQLVTAAEDDSDAIAWARSARPDACWFCAMLATRGAVYTSAEAAGQADPEEGETPIGLDSQGKEFVNRFHTNCRCQIVPVFRSRKTYEPAAHVRQWQALWNQTMRPNGKDGPGEITGMDNMQAAWKVAYADWLAQQH